jgi:tetratricopeptide (TPR) repeat protein
VPPAELVSGTAFFGDPIAAVPDTSSEILDIDPAMRAFVQQQVGNARTDSAKLQRLVRGMQRAGLLDLGYDGDATLTASQVFHQRRGNCLAATNLFVALARHAGLRVAFQEVEIPPAWIAESGFVMLDQHVNAVVHPRSGLATQFANDYVMDFNRPAGQGPYDAERVTDAHAFALYYTNVAVSYMRADDARGAVAQLARALALDANSVSAWVNLGALYSKQRHYEHAISAYLEAVRIDPSSKPALSNLANLHTFLGNDALAARYRQAVAYYQDHNPYYQYALAREAYERATYNDALRAIARAIKLKRDDHQFYLLRGVVALRLGDYGLARESLSKARQYAPSPGDKARYTAKLDALSHLAPPPR